MTDTTTRDWLLGAAEPWVRRGVMLDLEGRPHDDPEAEAARRETLADPRVQALIDDVLTWPWPPIKSHKQAKHPLHKAVLLTELGLAGSDPAGATLAERLIERQSEAGAFLSRVLLPKAFGGSGEIEWQWMGCDAPLVLHLLRQLGRADDERVQRAAAHLAALATPGGWGCDTSTRMRGPGRKGDPCPYATLVALRALAPDDVPACRAGTEMLLSHWAERTSGRRHYLFGIGTDFAKPKVPLVWYDLVHVLDVLSRYPWTRDDPRLTAMWAALAERADERGRYRPASVWMAFKGFDFAQKRGPSPTLTLVAERIRRRLFG